MNNYLPGFSKDKITAVLVGIAFLFFIRETNHVIIDPLKQERNMH